jgi:hypothetical protein
MPSFSYLRISARNLSTSDHPGVKALADIVEQLCQKCEDVEAAVGRAHSDAKKAASDAASALSAARR